LQAGWIAVVAWLKGTTGRRQGPVRGAGQGSEFVSGHKAK
jgi:hypothetical protein